MGSWTANEAGNAARQGGWTIIYRGWWISRAPFVGMFIARISRGRTIREFMVSVIFVPATVAFFWLCMFGGNSCWQELNSGGGPAAAGGAGFIETVCQWDPPTAHYLAIGNLSTMFWIGDVGWISWPLAARAKLLMASCFITSSDSGTLAITTTRQRFSGSYGASAKGSLLTSRC